MAVARKRPERGVCHSGRCRNRCCRESLVALIYLISSSPRRREPSQMKEMDTCLCGYDGLISVSLDRKALQGSALLQQIGAVYVTSQFIEVGIGEAQAGEVRTPAVDNPGHLACLN